MNKLIELNLISKDYFSGAQQVKALRDISLSVDSQDYLSIVGPSGAGKSTLLHVMGGLEPPTQGHLALNTKDVYRMKDKEISLWRNKFVGFVFQFYHLIEELNVLENIALAGFAKRRKSSLKKAQELLQYLGIEGRQKFFPSQLSGGEKQKVAIARALINEPQILLCDEPTGNLDKDSQEKVVRYLEVLNREMKKTIILVTHNLELASCAKRIIHIKDGAIVS